MKIRVLQNFGLDGENVERGQEIVVNKTQFGDNLESFVEAGYFEIVEPASESKEPAPEAEPTPDVEPSEVKKASGTKKATDASGDDARR